MQVRSIKAEFIPSFGIYITADCLIGNSGLQTVEKKKSAARGLEKYIAGD